MMAFFMTMPTSRMQAIEVTSVNWIAITHSASSAPNTVGSRVDRMVSGWM